MVVLFLAFIRMSTTWNTKIVPMSFKAKLVLPFSPSTARLECLRIVDRFFFLNVKLRYSSPSFLKAIFIYGKSNQLSN